MNALNTVQRAERLARMLVMPAIEVAAQLDRYGTACAEDRLASGLHSDESLENAMLARHDSLINLALAKNATQGSILGTLYGLACEPAKSSDDAKYKLGLRVSCVSNASSGISELSSFPTSWMTADVLQGLLQTGDTTECQALLANPSLSDNCTSGMARSAG